MNVPKPTLNRRRLLQTALALPVSHARSQEPAASQVRVAADLTAPATGWARFRGPNGSGVGVGTGYPSDLSVGKNLVWRFPIPPGKGSPIRVDNRLLLTADQPGKPKVICLDPATGKALWERSISTTRTTGRHTLNSAASPTPVGDGKNIYVFFTDVGLMSFDLSGKERWRVPLGPFSSLWGVASSPVLADGAAILQVDGIHDCYIAAFEQSTGKERWRIPRESNSHNYSTPIVRATRDGHLDILSLGPRSVIAYDSANGAKRWVADAPAGNIVGSLAMSDDTLFCTSYQSDAPISFESDLQARDKNRDGVINDGEFGTDERSTALRSAAQFMGNRDGILDAAEYSDLLRQWSGVSETRGIRLESSGGGGIRARTLWSRLRSVPHCPTPLLYEGVLYLLANGGILTALDPNTGEPIKIGRLPGALGNYYASPVAVDGKIYCISQSGTVSVVKAGRNWELLASTPLDEDCFATPALADSRVYVRTEASVFCFGQRS